jgi:predicted CXXCH cytochrome family protein
MTTIKNKVQMKFGWWGKTLIIGFVLLFIVGGAFGLEVRIGPASITLQTKEARKPADFPHRKHQDAYCCTVCHHVKGEIMVIDKCASCHNSDMGNAGVNSFKKAAHKLCKDCHKRVNFEGKDAPTNCSGCHPRKH